MDPNHLHKNGPILISMPLATLFQIVIFGYRKCRNTVATVTGHDTVEFLSEKNSKIQPNFKIQL